MTGGFFFFRARTARKHMMAPLSDLTPMAPIVAALNHLLAQEPWARQQLARHAGKLAAIDTGAVVVRLRIDSAGLLTTASPEVPASVTIRVKLSDLPLIAQNPQRAFSYVKIEGDAELANTISQVGKSVRWDAEHDLERLFGPVFGSAFAPVVATRLVSGARSAAAAVRTQQRKLAENVAEYFLDEQPLLIRPTNLAEYSAGVTRVRDDVERLAKRLARLEKALAASQPSTPSSDVPT